MTSKDEPVVHVTKARYAGGYRLELQFSDGSRKNVDFEQFLKSSTHPDIVKYLQTKKFRRFAITNGMLNWNEFDLVFPMVDLYNGRIE